MKTKHIYIAIFMLAIVLIAGCLGGEEEQDNGDEDGLMSQACPSSCDDNNECTTDYCSEETDYQCEHTTLSLCCGNSVCDENETNWDCPGDCGEPECYTPADCDDGEVCTTDACTDGVCSNIMEVGCQMVAETDLEIIHKNSFRSQDNVLHILGEVKNKGDSAVKNVTIDAILYSLSGRTLWEGSTQGRVNYIETNEVSPFEVLISNPPVEYFSYKLSVSGVNTTETPYTGLMIYRDMLTTSGGRNYVTGEVKNRGSGVATNVEAVVTYYNINGNVLGVAVDTASPSVLTPSEIATFNTSVGYTPTDIDIYAVTAQGERG